VKSYSKRVRKFFKDIGYDGPIEPYLNDLDKFKKCTAFPDGIPVDICHSKFLHFEKYPSQKNDIVFELNNSDVPDVQEMIIGLLEDFKEEYAKTRKK
jgi:hypothetical protein